MKSITSIAAVLALGLGHAFAADITYTVNNSVGAGSVTGTITTDGTFGALSNGDIVGFNLTLNNGVSSVGLNNTANLVYIGGDTTASATALQFNFSATDGGFLNFYNGQTCTAEYSFQSNNGPGCNGTPNNFNGVSVDSLLTDQSESGLVTFATAGGSTTPEPSSLMLLGTGVLGMAGAIRRRLK